MWCKILEWHKERFTVVLDQRSANNLRCVSHLFQLTLCGSTFYYVRKEAPDVFVKSVVVCRPSTTPTNAVLAFRYVHFFRRIFSGELKMFLPNLDRGPGFAGYSRYKHIIIFETIIPCNCLHVYDNCIVL